MHYPPGMVRAYRHVETLHRHEIPKVKGSRFIATVGPFSSEIALLEQISKLRGEFREANHHCWAWRDGEQFRYSDDGEPSGSAGRPILQQLDGAAVDRSLAIVTRIFGGTKLGVGGLVRAYGEAAREALAGASIVELIPTRRVRLRFDYELQGAMQSVIQARGWQPGSSEFDTAVTWVFDVALEAIAPFVEEIRERSAGRAAIDVEEAISRRDADGVHKLKG